MLTLVAALIRLRRCDSDGHDREAVVSLPRGYLAGIAEALAVVGLIGWLTRRTFVRCIEE